MAPLLQEFARAAREDALAEGQAKGLLIAMAGEKEVYANRAGRLFGSDAGRAVREHLRSMTDPDRLHEFGRKSLDCDTLEQLMALVVEDAPNGHYPG